MFNKKNILLEISLVIIIFLFTSCGNNEKVVTRVDVDSILYPGKFPYDEINYEPLYTTEQWINEEGHLLYPYENALYNGGNIDMDKSMLLIPEEVLEKASTEELLKVAYDGWLCSWATAASLYDMPSYYVSFCTGSDPASNEVFRRSDMVEVIFADYCSRDYIKGTEYSEEKVFEFNKLQYSEIVLGSNHGYSLMDNSMRKKVISEILKKNEQLCSGECFAGDATLTSGFFAIIEEEYYNGNSDWYTYLCENYPDVVEEYIDVDSYPSWRQ